MQTIKLEAAVTEVERDATYDMCRRPHNSTRLATSVCLSMAQTVLDMPPITQNEMQMHTTAPSVLSQYPLPGLSAYLTVLKRIAEAPSSRARAARMFSVGRLSRPVPTGRGGCRAAALLSRTGCPRQLAGGRGGLSARAAKSEAKSLYRRARQAGVQVIGVPAQLALDDCLDRSLQNCSVSSQLIHYF